jgi:hypothetical protein
MPAVTAINHCAQPRVHFLSCASHIANKTVEDKEELLSALHNWPDHTYPSSHPTPQEAHPNSTIEERSGSRVFGPKEDKRKDDDFHSEEEEDVRTNGTPERFLIGRSVRWSDVGCVEEIDNRALFV